MTDQNRTETFTVPAYKTGVVFRNVRKLNKKAAVTRAGKFEVEIGNERTINVEPINSIEWNDAQAETRRIPVRVIDVTITGPDFSMGDYSLAAMADFDIPSAPIFSDFNDNDFAGYNEITTECEHCNKSRARRKMFVLKNNKSGEFVQVGKSCLKDFTGFTVFDALKGAGFWGDLRDDLEGLLRRGRMETYNSLSYVVAVAVAVIEQNGYVSRDAANRDGGTATADDVRETINENFKPSAANIEAADVIISWAKTEYIFDYNDADKNNAFVLNMSNIVEAGNVTNGMVGFAACLPAMKSRADAKAAAAKLAGISEHFGNVKDRIEAEVTVESVSYFDSFYGTTTLYSMTCGNNVVKWFSSRDVLDNGKTYKVKMTVKSHDEYKGTKQTVVTRVAVQ